MWEQFTLSSVEMMETAASVCTYLARFVFLLHLWSTQPIGCTDLPPTLNTRSSSLTQASLMVRVFH